MSLKKNVVYNTILTVSNVAFPIVTTPYVSRILGVENIGIVNFAVTYASYFALFVALGIPMYGMREIAKQNNNPEGRNQVFSELFVINVLSAIIFSTVYLVTIFSVPTLSHDREFLLITGISVLFVPFNVDWFFSGREKFKLVTLRTLAAKVIAVGGLFIFVRTREDIIPYLILTVAANLSSQIWNFGYMLKTEVKFRLKHLQIKKHLNAVLVLFASNIAISVYTMLSTLILGFMSDYTQVGYYTSANKISRIITIVVTSISPVMIARINTIKGKKDNQSEILQLLNNSFGYMMMLAVPATIGLIVVAPRFVPLFFGVEFIPATVSLQLLSLLIVIIGLSNLFGIQVLVAMGHEKKLLIAVLFGAVSNFCLNVLLAGKYGSVGASVASIITETMVTTVTFIFALKITPIHIKIGNIFQPILASLPIIKVSLFANHVIEDKLIYLSITIVISGILYSIIMIFVFKNEQAIQIAHSIATQIKKYTNNKLCLI
ncbi:MAG: flippase [Bacteroidales bacterium]|jgi:O-antigen/teichoic acid export membrane protein|nr:flippase [Bacteroidales bacterium]